MKTIHVLLILLTVLASITSSGKDIRFFSSKFMEHLTKKDIDTLLKFGKLDASHNLQGWTKTYGSGVSSTEIKIRDFSVTLTVNSQNLSFANQKNQITASGKNVINLKATFNYHYVKTYFPVPFSGMGVITAQSNSFNFAKHFFKDSNKGKIVPTLDFDMNLVKIELKSGFISYFATVIKTIWNDMVAEVKKLPAKINDIPVVSMTNYYKQQMQKFPFTYNIHYNPGNVTINEHWNISQDPEFVKDGMIAYGQTDTNFTPQNFKNFDIKNGEFQRYINQETLQKHADVVSNSGNFKVLIHNNNLPAGIDLKLNVAYLAEVYPDISTSHTSDETFYLNCVNKKIKIQNLNPLEFTAEMQCQAISEETKQVLFEYKSGLIVRGKFESEKYFDIKIISLDIASISVDPKYEGVNQDTLKTYLEKGWDTYLSANYYSLYGNQFPDKMNNVKLVYPSNNELVVAGNYKYQAAPKKNLK